METKTNRYGKPIGLKCSWIVDSPYYGFYRDFNIHCKTCVDKDKCNPPKDTAKRGYQYHPNSIVPINPPEYNRWGDRMYLATCPNCGKKWNTKFWQKTTCGSQGGKDGCGYQFKTV